MPRRHLSGSSVQPKSYATSRNSQARSSDGFSRDLDSGTFPPGGEEVAASEEPEEQPTAEAAGDIDEGEPCLYECCVSGCIRETEPIDSECTPAEGIRVICSNSRCTKGICISFFLILFYKYYFIK